MGPPPGVKKGEDATYVAKSMVNLGVFRYSAGLKDNAVEYFKGALEADPLHETAHANLKALGFELKKR